jgi:hypothetical protein
VQQAKLLLALLLLMTGFSLSFQSLSTTRANQNNNFQIVDSQIFDPVG